jgi:hypothetical protein
MHVEPLGLEACEPADDSLELATDLVEIVQALFETEVIEIIGAKFVAQEYREFLILPENRALEVGAEDMMAMLDLVDHSGKLASVLAMQARAEDLSDLVRGQPPQPSSQLRSNSLWMGKLRLKIKLKQYSI